MREIVELNNRLITAGAITKEMGVVLVAIRATLRPDIDGLPIALRMELESLCQRLNRVIPTDFSGCIELGEKPDLSLEFNDGPQAAALWATNWDHSQSIFEQFEEIDWNSHRARSLSECQAFEDLKERAKHAPPSLPSTKQLQRIFRDEMREFVKRERQDRSKVHVLIFRKEEAENAAHGMVKENFDNLQVFGKELIDIMPFGNWIVAVVADGKPVPVGKIDELKRWALDELQKHMPISHAKALGRIGPGVMSWLGPKPSDGDKSEGEK